MNILETLEKLNSLFDLGCDVQLDEEFNMLAVTGYDYSEYEGMVSQALQSSVVERSYSCDCYDDEGKLSMSGLDDLILSIEEDNASIKAPKN